MPTAHEPHAPRAASSGFRVSCGYIEWAHGPGAESGQGMAQELCAMADAATRSYIVVPAERTDLMAEIASVAELYVGGDDNDLRAARVLRRARQALTGLGAGKPERRSAGRTA